MYMLSGPSPTAAQLYFVALVFFGSFFVFNLFLVVVADHYITYQRQVFVVLALRCEVLDTGVCIVSLCCVHC